jgi:hypothetical protein
VFPNMLIKTAYASPCREEREAIPPPRHGDESTGMNMRMTNR